MNKELNKKLTRACKNKDVQGAKQAIKDGADVNARDEEDKIALHYSACVGCTELTELLISLGSNINATDFWGQTPLFMTCFFDRFEDADLLIKSGAKVNVTNLDRISAVNKCCYNGSHKVLSLLIKAKASIRTKDEYGNTALMIVAKYANIKVYNEEQKKMKEMYELLHKHRFRL